MGMDRSAVMVIHGGGVYGNKAEALKTFEENYSRLKESTRNRLVLENDEMVETVEFFDSFSLPLYTLDVHMS